MIQVERYLALEASSEWAGDAGASKIRLNHNLIVYRLAPATQHRQLFSKLTVVNIQ